jgi:hypothetical protein
MPTFGHNKNIFNKLLWSLLSLGIHPRKGKPG